MAQKIQTFFIDDLDGSEAEGTVLFGLDGTHYEIDLSTGHAKELRSALARYIKPAGGSQAPPAQPRTDARLPQAASATPRYASGPKRKTLRSRTVAGSRLTSSPSTGRQPASRTRRRILILAPTGPRQLPRPSGEGGGAGAGVGAAMGPDLPAGAAGRLQGRLPGRCRRVPADDRLGLTARTCPGRSRNGAVPTQWLPALDRHQRGAQQHRGVLADGLSAVASDPGPQRG